MAGKKETTKEQMKVYKGVAKQSIKYAGKFLNKGDKFIIAEKDIEELGQYADVEEVIIDEKEEGLKEGE